MYHDADDEQDSWRSNWFVKNVFSELPIIGGFFRTSKVSDSLSFIGKSVVTLAAGSTAMLLIPMEMEDSMPMKFAKATAGMAIGMSGGTMIYNTVSSLGMTIYYKCCQKRNSKLSEDESLETYFAVREKISFESSEEQLKPGWVPPEERSRPWDPPEGRSKRNSTERVGSF